MIRRPRPTEPNVLLTGFMPFAGEASNPSWEAVRALEDSSIHGHRVVVAELPTTFGASLPALRHALRTTRPRVAIAVGLAGGRAGISLERVAINLIDARIPDNAGDQPIDVPVMQRGSAAYFATLPLKASLLALEHAGIAAHVSQSAGTFVCNQVFYGLMHAGRRRHGLRAGFVHVPWSPEQAGRHHQPGMPIAEMTKALHIVLHTTLTVEHDAVVAAGAES